MTVSADHIIRVLAAICIGRCRGESDVIAELRPAFYVAREHGLIVEEFHLTEAGRECLDKAYAAGPIEAPASPDPAKDDAG